MGQNTYDKMRAIKLETYKYEGGIYLIWSGS